MDERWMGYIFLRITTITFACYNDLTILKFQNIVNILETFFKHSINNVSWQLDSEPFLLLKDVL